MDISQDGKYVVTAGGNLFRGGYRSEDNDLRNSIDKYITLWTIDGKEIRKIDVSESFAPSIISILPKKNLNFLRPPIKEFGGDSHYALPLYPITSINADTENTALPGPGSPYPGGTGRLYFSNVFFQTVKSSQKYSSGGPACVPSVV